MIHITMTNPQASLPPGFRFHPTDEELILHYLQKKASSIPLPVSIIAEVDIYKFNPWDLPAMAAFGEKEWYFFSPRDRKYPNGARPNRAAASGYWKATGTDKVITNSSRMGARNENVGVKKALVFYKGRPPKGTKTNWIMHEYRLTESPCTVHPTDRLSTPRLKDSSMRLDDWVLYRIYKKSNMMSPAAAVIPPIDPDHEVERCINAQDTKLTSLTSLPGNTNTGIGNNLLSQKSSSFSSLIDLADFTMLGSLLYDNNSHLTSLSCLESSDSTLTVTPNINHTNHIAPATNTSIPVIQNVAKRQNLGVDADMSQPSNKKFSVSACSFPTSGAVGTQFDVPGQYNYMFNNHSFLNQQLLLSPNAPFLG